MPDPWYRLGYVTVGQAADALGVGRKAVNSAIGAGHLAAFRTATGRSWWLIDPGDLDRLVEAAGYRYRPSPPGTLLDVDPAEARCGRSS